MDNYAAGASGTPGEAKTGPGYVRQVQVDSDDDGRVDRSTTIPAYDLLYLSRRTNGRIFLSSFPLSRRRSEAELAILGRLYVEAVSGTGFEVQAIEGAVTVTERRFATRVVSEQDVTLGGAPAREVVFEIANLDQLNLDPAARWERGRIVLSRPGLFWSSGDTLRAANERMPVLVVAGYTNHPDDYDQESPDFDGWLRAFDFNPVDVDEAHRTATLACWPDSLTVPVLLYRNLGSQSGQRTRVAIPGGNPTIASCVRDVLRDLDLRDEHSWVFVRR